MFNIRLACESDVSDVLLLLDEVSDLHGEMRKDIFVNKPRHITKEKLLRYLKDEKHYVLIIENQGVIDGVMLCTIRDYVNDLKYKDNRVMSIEDTCIRRECRSNHYGTYLLKEAEKIARTFNCQRLETNVWSFNEPSYRWLKGNGFNVQRRILERVLD